MFQMNGTHTDTHTDISALTFVIPLSLWMREDGARASVNRQYLRVHMTFTTVQMSFDFEVLLQSPT